MPKALVAQGGLSGNPQAAGQCWGVSLCTRVPGTEKHGPWHFLPLAGSPVGLGGAQLRSAQRRPRATEAWAELTRPPVTAASCWRQA